jgi:hypothetical protein
MVILQNFSIMSEYMTPMGRIKHSNETGLRPVNQRSEGHKKEYWNGNDAEARVLSDDNDSCHLSMGRNTKSPLHTIPISAQLFICRAFQFQATDYFKQAGNHAAF